MISVEARVSALTGLMSWVRGQVGAVSTREAHQELFLEDELFARVVGGGVNAGVHADCVDRAGFDAEAAEDAAQLVDHEALWEALVAPARVAFRIFGGFDVNALCRASGGAAQARDAARRAVLALREPMYAAEARRVRSLLLGIGDAVDAVFDAFQHRIVALTEGHLFRVLKEMLHRDPETLGDLGDVGLHGGGALGTRHRDAHDFFRTQSCGFVVHADIRALRVPPAAAAY